MMVLHIVARHGWDFGTGRQGVIGGCKMAGITVMHLETRLPRIRLGQLRLCALDRACIIKFGKARALDVLRDAIA